MDFVPTLKSVLEFDRYGDNQCCWKTTKNAKCRKPISQPNLKIINSILREFHNDSKIPVKKALDHLQVLSGLIICQNKYHQKYSELVLQDWISEIQTRYSNSRSNATFSTQWSRFLFFAVPQPQLFEIDIQRVPSNGKKISSIKPKAIDCVEAPKPRLPKPVCVIPSNNPLDTQKCIKDSTIPIQPQPRPDIPTSANTIILSIDIKEKTEASVPTVKPYTNEMPKDLSFDTGEAPSQAPQVPIEDEEDKYSEENTEAVASSPENYTFMEDNTTAPCVSEAKNDLTPSKEGAEVLETTGKDNVLSHPQLSLSTQEDFPVQVENQETPKQTSEYEVSVILGLNPEIGAQCQHIEDSVRCKNHVSEILHRKTPELITQLKDPGLSLDEVEDLLDSLSLATHCKQLHRVDCFKISTKWLAAFKAHNKHQAGDKFERIETNTEYINNSQTLNSPVSSRIDLGATAEDKYLSKILCEKALAALEETSTPRGGASSLDSTPQTTDSSVFTPTDNLYNDTPPTSPSITKDRSRPYDESPIQPTVKQRDSLLISQHDDSPDTQKQAERADPQILDTGDSSTIDTITLLPVSRRLFNTRSRSAPPPRGPQVPFLPFANINSSSPISIHEKIISLMGRRISENDTSGFVYAFTRDSFPGLTKIGRTARHFAVRVAEQERKCRFRAVMVTQVHTPWQVRLEDLVHAELLMGRRWEQQCNGGEGCLTRHNEWFEVDKQVIIRTVQRWRDWLNLGVYDAASRALTRTWQERLESLLHVHGSSWEETWKAWMEKFLA